MEREVFAVLGPVGVEEKLSRQVAQNLLNVEMETSNKSHVSSPSQSSDIESDSNGLRWSKDVGLTAFLLKFGEGLGILFLIQLPSETNKTHSLLSFLI